MLVLFDFHAHLLILGHLLSWFVSVIMFSYYGNSYYYLEWELCNLDSCLNKCFIYKGKNLLWSTWGHKNSMHLQLLKSNCLFPGLCRSKTVVMQSCAILRNGAIALTGYRQVWHAYILKHPSDHKHCTPLYIYCNCISKECCVQQRSGNPSQVAD